LNDEELTAEEAVKMGDHLALVFSSPNLKITPRSIVVSSWPTVSSDDGLGF